MNFMTKLNINYNDPLPDKYEAMMPENLSPYDKFEWRKHKVGELRAQRLLIVDDNGNCTFVEQSEQTSSSVVTAPSVATVAPDSAASKVQDDVAETKQPESVSKPAVELKSKPKTSKRPATSIPKSLDAEYEDIRSVPKSVMQAVRKLFPETASKADLVSAIVYIFTNGECEISERAMEIVKSYQADDTLVSINERLARLERENKRHLELLQAIELCTCYNAYDRRYGSNEPRRGPKLTEFREQGSLDMLERLREQARDQMRTDDLAIGRQIYNQTKDLDD